MSDDKRGDWMGWAESVCALSIGRDRAFGRLSRTIAYPLGDAPAEWAFDPVDCPTKPLTIGPLADGDSFGAPE